MQDIRHLLGTHRKKIQQLFLSAGGVVLLNAVLQLFVYPQIKKTLGTEGFGTALSMLALVSLISGALGNAAGLARLFKKEGATPSNADYVLIILGGSVFFGALGLFLLRRMGGDTTDSVLFVLLVLTSTFRYYSDVEFKQTGNALRYFAFYACVTLGYVAGLFFYPLTKRWLTVLLIGELLGILYARLKSSIYEKVLRPSGALFPLLGQTALLLLSGLLEGLPFYADRVLLFTMVGAEAVTVFYTASLFGKVTALLATPASAMLVGFLVRYEKPLSKMLWLSFLSVSLVLGLLGTLACLLASHLFLPVLYGDVFIAAEPFLLPAISAQVLFFVSGVLMVVLLRYYGEKLQLFLNVLFAFVFFSLAFFLTRLGGLQGFVHAALIANALRFLLLAACGFLPQRSASQAPCP